MTELQRAEVCVGAILTQNTSWTNVLKALASLRAAGVGDLRAIARTPGPRLARLIRSSGYFRQKAKKLKLFAAHAASRGPLSRWLSGPLAGLREELLGLWGVGPETTDSILLYAGGRASLVVDAYTARLGRRLGWFTARDDYRSIQRKLAAALPADPVVYSELHALIVELGKRHCRATPECEGCPLRAGCRHGQKSR